MRRVTVLVSVGCNPASGRARRAADDARAVELALRLARSTVTLLHAGAPPGRSTPEDGALRDYAGMGATDMTILDCGPDGDPLPALIDHLRRFPAELILTGRRAEGGEDSGLVPYLVAEALGYPLVDNVVDVRPTGSDGAGADGLDFIQARPRGRRRLTRAWTACVATVGSSAPAPRLAAFAAARRARVEVVSGPRVRDPAPETWSQRPARPRPRRMKRVTGTAAERVLAATSVQSRGRIVADADADQAARIIYAALVAQGVAGAANDS